MICIVKFVYLYLYLYLLLLDKVCLDILVLDSESDNEIFRKNVLRFVNDPDVIIIVGGNSPEQLNMIKDAIEASNTLFIYPYTSWPSFTNSTSIFYSGGLISQLITPFYNYVAATYPSSTTCIYLLYPNSLSSKYTYEFTNAYCLHKEVIYYDGSRTIQEISDYLDTFSAILLITVMLRGKDLEEYMNINCNKSNGFKEKNIHYYSFLDLEQSEYLMEYCNNRQIESSLFYYSKLHGKNYPDSSLHHMLDVEKYNLSNIIEYDNYQKIHIDVFGSKVLQRKQLSLFVMMNMFLQTYHIIRTKWSNVYSKSEFVKELYKLRIETSYTTFSISATNYLLYPVSILNMTNEEELIVINPDTTLINPYGFTNNSKQYVYVDYRTGLIRTQDIKTIAIVFQGNFLDVTYKEREVYRGIALAIRNINNKGGLIGYFINYKCITVDDIENSFKDDCVVGYFLYVNSIKRKELYPLFEKYNKLMWYLPDYEGNECKRNIIYTGTYPHQVYDIIENYYQLNSISSVLLYINIDDYYLYHSYTSNCGKRIGIIEFLGCIYFSVKVNNFTLDGALDLFGNKSEKTAGISVIIGQCLSNPLSILKKISQFVNQSNIQITTDIYPYTVNEKDRYLLNNTIFGSPFVEELILDETTKRYSFVNNSLTQLKQFQTDYYNMFGRRHATDVMYNAYVAIQIWKVCITKATLFETDEILKVVDTMVLTPYSSISLQYNHHVERPIMISKYINNKNRIIYLIDTSIESPIIEDNNVSIINCDFSNPSKPLERIEVPTIPIFIIYKIGTDSENNYTGVYHSFMMRLISDEQVIIPDVLSKVKFKTIVFSYTDKSEIFEGFSLLQSMSKITLCLLFCPSQDLDGINQYSKSNILFIHIDDFSSNKIVQENYISFSYNEEHLYEVTKYLFSMLNFNTYITLEMEDDDVLYLFYCVIY